MVWTGRSYRPPLAQLWPQHAAAPMFRSQEQEPLKMLRLHRRTPCTKSSRKLREDRCPQSPSRSFASVPSRPIEVGACRPSRPSTCERSSRPFRRPAEQGQIDSEEGWERRRARPGPARPRLCSGSAAADRRPCEAAAPKARATIGATGGSRLRVSLLTRRGAPSGHRSAPSRFPDESVEARCRWAPAILTVRAEREAAAAGALLVTDGTFL
jgi:hypothetical protein